MLRLFGIISLLATPTPQPVQAPLLVPSMPPRWSKTPTPTVPRTRKRTVIPALMK